VVAVDDVPYGWAILDIGPRTRRLYAEALAGARTIFWNGPMGVCEWPVFREGTHAIARAIAEADAYSVVGGGDTLSAINQFGVADAISWASTGGGAALEFLQGKELPGLAVIPSP
jgi:phosphoglycerate kinase